MDANMLYHGVQFTPTLLLKEEVKEKKMIVNFVN